MRQAVRPVMMAYRILSDERLAASALAEEAQTLVTLTEDLLRRLGLVHLLTAGVARAADGTAPADRADSLVEAYARAGMSWAKVVSSVTRLAGLMIEEGDWESARRTASLLAESGERALAAHIESRLSEALVTTVVIHAHMTAPEIRRAVSVLIALGDKQREDAIRTWRVLLLQSAHSIAAAKQIKPAQELASQLWERANTLAPRPDLETHPAYSLPSEVLFTGLMTISDLCEG